MEPVRVAIVGLGMAVKPHAEAVEMLNGTITVIRAATRTAARAEAFSSRYGVAASTDVDGVMTDPSVEAVIVLTPPDTHLSVAGRALAAGKHVLVEKPLDSDPARAAELVALARREGRTLGVVLQHRFRDAALRLAEVIADETLGEIVSAALAVPWWRPQTYYDEPGRGTLARDGGGVLLTQAIHAVDLFRSLTGPVEVLAAQAVTTPSHRMETEDYAAALLRLRGGAPGSLTATTAFYPGEPERIEIAGTRGSALLLGDALRVSRIGGTVEEVAAGDAGGGGADPMAFSPEPHRRLLADFAEAVRARRQPRASGEEALRTQILIGDILAAARLLD